MLAPVFEQMLTPLMGSGQGDSGPDQCVAARCTEEFRRSLILADRPQITKFEKTFPEEASAIQRMTRRAACAVITNYCQDTSVDPRAKAFRDQHAKAHGCVRANFIVRDDLPDEFAVGVFRRGARYHAVVRFSNARPTPQSDRKWDGRGMAIKLLGAPERTVLSILVPDLARHWEQDFVLGSYPVFFCRNIVDYEQFMDALLAPTGNWCEWLVRAAKWAVFIVGHPRQMLLFLRIGMKKITDPLNATYHSMAPYLFGDDRVVRYIVSPSAVDNGLAPRPGRSQSADFLREALAAELDPVRRPGERVLLDFSINLLNAADANKVEDATRWWNGPLDQKVLLGHIEIPVQNFATPDDIYACENIAFNPWNCLWQHQPLGSLNRMRLAVYLVSLQVRHKLNMLAQ